MVYTNNGRRLKRRQKMRSWVWGPWNCSLSYSQFRKKFYTSGHPSCRRCSILIGIYGSVQIKAIKEQWVSSPFALQTIFAFYFIKEYIFILKICEKVKGKIWEKNHLHAYHPKIISNMSSYFLWPSFLSIGISYLIVMWVQFCFMYIINICVFL